MSRFPVRLPLAVLLLAACAASVKGPSEPHWGIDECSDCHMILSSPDFASAAVGATGEELHFDDHGCLIAWLAARPAGETWTIWVHDADSTRWLEAESAWFAVAKARATPMGSGITAHGSRAAALAVSPRSEPLTWSQLLATQGHTNPTTTGGSL